METMYDCYLSQFSCFKKILVQKDNLLNGFTDFYHSTNPDRIYLVGSGTSFNACASAAEFMESCLGIEIITVAPTRIGKIYGKRALVIAVSQSGRSTNTIGALRKIKDAGAAVVTLTDPKETPVSMAGDLALHLAADQELIGPKTRGYMATVLTLHLLALEAGLAEGRLQRAFYDKSLNAYAETAALGEEYFATCQSFYDKNLDDLKSTGHVLFVGKGVSAKVADEGALKVLETLCYPASGYEYEEFLHGPICCIDDKLAIFFFLAGDEDRNRMLKTADIISAATKNCYIISHDPEVQGEKILYLPTPDAKLCSPFTDVLFSQLISAKLTEALQRKRHPAVSDISSKMGTKTPE